MQSACLRPIFCDVRMRFLRRKGQPQQNCTGGVPSGWRQQLGRGGGGFVATARTGRSWAGSTCAQTERTGAHEGRMGFAVPSSTDTCGAGCGAPAACGGRVVASAAPVSVTASLRVGRRGVRQAEGRHGATGGGGRRLRKERTAQRKRAAGCGASVRNEHRSVNERRAVRQCKSRRAGCDCRW